MKPYWVYRLWQSIACISVYHIEYVCVNSRMPLNIRFELIVSFLFACLPISFCRSPHWNFTLNIYANVHVNFYTARTTQSSEDAASRQRCDAHPNHWYANQERTTSFPSQMAKLHRTLHMQFKAEHSVRWQTSKRVTCRYCRIILSKSHCQMMYKKKKKLSWRSLLAVPRACQSVLYARVLSRTE